ncbi:GNAT family N-acetyltransferase [Mucilaginibacter sp. RS28]|uniref:GNAT family N-acetyltransferase n=1 Tax=Mucilaginibacter straminoryzae TaxID=2932774 RepID=A0A9X1X2U2_9SPHI|nr:GNAT family protein [Mucilaginibacter straminoryzae]MCJ8209315.1 GNAT family N-acetyltransferase [Mucilaginibacter straminoryzae]
MTANLSPVLSNAKVVLRPLELADAGELLKIAQDEDNWKYGNINFSKEESLQAYLSAAIADRDKGTAAVWTIVDPITNKIAGSTRLAEIDFHNSRAQIGWTWINKDVRGTGLNKAMKYEILKYGFETLGLHRIELKADERNLRSRNAILGIGAKFEGILREHMKLHDGFMRSSAYYSILQSEWAEVKAMLEAKLSFI